MSPENLSRIIFVSAAEVLECMFFTSPAEDAAPSPPASEGYIGARLLFHGKPSGRFGIRTPLETGGRIAANFLGVEEDSLTEGQIGEVIRELANMLCGSVLSRLEEHERFDLSQPQLDLAEDPEKHTAYRLVALEEGPLAIWLDLRQNP